uniref:Uncharacterized protein n=1 Tax=Glossina austeni TaxID=7395 RepID=A0A1A9UXC8_GLOAU
MRRLQKLKQLNQKLIENKLLREEINSLEAEKIKLEENQNKSREKQLELEKKLKKMKAKNACEKDVLEKELNSLRKEQQTAEDEVDKAIAEFDEYICNLIQECSSSHKKLRIEFEKEILEGEVKQLIEAKERQRTELEKEISELKTKHSNELETLKKHRQKELLRAEDERREVVDERNRLKERLDKLQKRK